MSKTYGWYSCKQEGETGNVYVYKTLDGKSEAVLTEATSRADYTPIPDDAVSLGEVGRFIRTEKRERVLSAEVKDGGDAVAAESAAAEPAAESAAAEPAAEPVALSKSAVAAMSRISESVQALTPDQQEEVAEALLAEAADDAAKDAVDVTKESGDAAAAMGDLDLTPVSVSAATAPPPAETPDDALDLDDLIGSLEDV